jgi:hypothetical protein
MWGRGDFGQIGNNEVRTVSDKVSRALRSSSYGKRHNHRSCLYSSIIRSFQRGWRDSQLHTLATHCIGQIDRSPNFVRGKQKQEFQAQKRGFVHTQLTSVTFQIIDYNSMDDTCGKCRGHNLAHTAANLQLVHCSMSQSSVWKDMQARPISAAFLLLQETPASFASQLLQWMAILVVLDPATFMVCTERGVHVASMDTQPGLIVPV